MTYSTKQALVEHVARVIDPCVWSIWDGPDQWRKIQNNHRRNVSLGVARAAIRATLEWARDNVSEEVVAAGQNAVDSPFYADIEVQYRAMLSALIQELDRGDGG